MDLPEPEGPTERRDFALLGAKLASARTFSPATAVLATHRSQKATSSNATSWPGGLERLAAPRQRLLA